MATLPRYGYPSALDIVDTVNDLSAAVETALIDGGGSGISYTGGDGISIDGATIKLAPTSIEDFRAYIGYKEA